MKRCKFFLLLLVSLVTLAGCQQSQNPKEKLLSRKWSFVSVTDSTGKSLKQVTATDMMAVTQDKKFVYDIAKENIHSSGSWALQGDTLIYTYEPKDVASDIDSSAYAVKNGTPQVTYYKDGKVLAMESGSGLSPNKLTRKYRIDTLSEQQLSILENGVRYTFKPAQQAVATGFSWMGFLNGLIGVFSLTVLAFLFSANRKAIRWSTVIRALLLQIIFAFLVLRVPLVRDGFASVASVFVTVLQFVHAGSSFLFGGLVDNTDSFGYIFVFQVLPTIIFFSALTSALFYLNILQWIVYGFAWIMNKLLHVSGAESLSSAANIFLGQTEAPLLVKPYISGMTRSEILALMTGGMASIAGGVMAAYIGFLGGSDPEQQRLFATHLLSASIMTAPATFFAAKMLVPETEDFNKNMQIAKEKIGSNILDAIANGTIEGLRLAVNVAGMLLVFIAFMAMINWLFLHGIGSWTGLNEKIQLASHGKYEGLTLQYMLGYALSPVAWLIGIRGADVPLVGQLLGQKVILNEFVAYVAFGGLKAAGAFTYTKSVIITTYALCGFANFSSIGIQLGGIGTLAPTKRPMLASLGMRALLAATIANLMSGAIAGMML